MQLYISVSACMCVERERGKRGRGKREKEKVYKRERKEIETSKDISLYILHNYIAIHTNIVLLIYYTQLLLVKFC